MNRRPDSLEVTEAICKAGVAAFGTLDQLVITSGNNKAGVIHEMDYEDWQDAMDANVCCAWLMAKAVGSYWIQNAVKGKMLLMSSVRGRHGNISGYTAYCTSKGATDSLTRVLATEWARYGIAVNAIAHFVPLETDRLDVRRHGIGRRNTGPLAEPYSLGADGRGRGFDRHGALFIGASAQRLHRPGDVYRRRIYGGLMG